MDHPTGTAPPRRPGLDAGSAPAHLLTSPGHPSLDLDEQD